jgi:YD repeat-containing protein
MICALVTINAQSAGLRHGGGCQVQTEELNEIQSASMTILWNGIFKGASDGVAVTARTTNSRNQATAVGVHSLTYDNNGNVTLDETGNTYGYDAWNRMTSVTLTGGLMTVTYTYDALGRSPASANCTGTAAAGTYYSRACFQKEQRR